MSNSYIWPIYRTLSGATTLGQSGPESDGKKRGILYSPNLEPRHQIFFMSYLGHSLGRGGFYPSAEMQSVYSKAAQLTGLTLKSRGKKYQHYFGAKGIEILKDSLYYNFEDEWGRNIYLGDKWKGVKHLLLGKFKNVFKNDYQEKKKIFLAKGKIFFLHYLLNISDKCLV